MKTTALTRLAVVAVAAAALAGCSVINPITTQNHYAPADGVQVAIGSDARGLDLLVVTTAKDAPAVLTGSIYNDGTEELDVTISIDGVIAAHVKVPSDGTVKMGTREGEVLVQGTSPAAPGGIAPVWIGVAETGALQFDIPIVDGTLPQYQGIVDSIPPLPIVTPSPSPSTSPSPSVSPTP